MRHAGQEVRGYGATRRPVGTGSRRAAGWPSCLSLCLLRLGYPWGRRQSGLLGATGMGRHRGHSGPSLRRLRRTVLRRHDSAEDRGHRQRIDSRSRAADYSSCVFAGWRRFTPPSSAISRKRLTRIMPRSNDCDRRATDPAPPLRGAQWRSGANGSSSHRAVPW